MSETTGATQANPQPRRKRKLWKKLLLVVGVLILIGVILHLPIPSKLTISRETTYIDGPLRADGTPNYTEFVNSRLAEGVTPENNAAVLLAQAYGTEFFGNQTRDESLKRIGSSEGFGDGPYFVSFEPWAKARLKEQSATQPQSSSVAANPGGKRERSALTDLSDTFRAALTQPWAQADHRELADYLKANEAPLDMVVKASARPRLYLPLLPADAPLYRAISQNVGYIHNSGKALCVRAMAKLHDGDVSGAWADVMAVHRLSRLLGQPRLLIHCLIGTSLSESASRCTRQIALSGKLSAMQARQMLLDLDGLAPGVPCAEVLDHNERLNTLSAAIAVWSGDKEAKEIMRTDPDGPSIFGKTSFDCDESLRVINARYDKWVQWARTPYCERTAEKAPDLYTDQPLGGTHSATEITLLRLGGWATRKKFTNIILVFMMDVLSPPVYRTADLEERQLMEFDLARLSLALQAYKAGKGKYPDSLDELAPGYVEKVPADRFTGKPLIYENQGDGYLLKCELPAKLVPPMVMRL